jgi:hypothetical protein
MNITIKKKNILPRKATHSGPILGVKLPNTGNFERVCVLERGGLFVQSVAGATCPDVWEDKHDGKEMEWACKTGRTGTACPKAESEWGNEGI